MRKLVCFFILAAAAVCSIGCIAQRGIDRHYAFFRKTSKGVNDRFNNTPVTSEGKQQPPPVKFSISDTTYFIFLETVDSSTPSIDAVNIDSRSYNASVIKVLQNPLQLGKTIEPNGEEFIITAEGKKQWWQIQLNGVKGSAGVHNRSNEIIIKGLLANKTFQISVKLKELQPEAAM